MRKGPSRAHGVSRQASCKAEAAACIAADRFDCYVLQNGATCTAQDGQGGGLQHPAQIVSVKIVSVCCSACGSHECPRPGTSQSPGHKPVAPFLSILSSKGSFQQLRLSFLAKDALLSAWRGVQSCQATGHPRQRRKSEHLRLLPRNAMQQDGCCNL